MEFTIKVLIKPEYLVALDVPGFLAYQCSHANLDIVKEFGIETFILTNDFPLKSTDVRNYFTITVNIAESQHPLYRAHKGLLEMAAMQMRKHLVKTLGERMFHITIEGQTGTRKVNGVKTTR